MLNVKASVKPSPINGLGLFADEDIKKGTITWKYNPRFDISFDPKEVAQMSDWLQNFIKTYSYLSKESNNYIYSIDDSRFTNHSAKNANIDTIPFPESIETYGVANRDIKKGEEILVNYTTFDQADENSDEAYLKN